MGLFTWRQERPSTLTAAATRVKLKDQNEAKRALKRRQKWQEDALDYFDSVGEVKFGAYFVGNALSKLRLFIGYRAEPDSEPVPVSEMEEGEKPPGTEQALEALNRLRSPVSGHSEIMRRLGVNLSVPGECYLVGRDKDDDEKERWAIHSIDEVIPDNQGFKLIEATDEFGADQGKVELGEPDFVLRIWLPHPRRTQLADSPLRGVLDICEELLLLERAVRAQAKSRIPAGVWAIPEELSSGPLQPTGGDGEESTEDKFMEDLARALVTPIEDEADASAVVPFIVRGKGDLVAKLKDNFISFAREGDKYLEERTERALKRLAQGMSIPPEVILGLGESSHWNAWIITDEAFRGIEPLAMLSCESLTMGYLHPALMTEPNKIPPEDAQKLMIGYDPARLVVRPNRGEDAKDLHDRIVISDQALRDAADFDDDDAPDDEEKARREELKRPAQRDAPVDQDQGPPETGDDAPTEDDGETASAITAAARTDVSDIGRRLHQIDRELKARLEASFDAALRRALERAGSMIWNKAKSRKDLKDVVQGVARPDMAMTLGAKIIGSLGLTEEAMLETAIDSLKDSFNRWVERAQGAALNLVPNLTDEERDAVEPLQKRDRQDAWEWTRGALFEVARSLLYDPSPDPPERGEFDALSIVPAALIREAVARAGGAVAEDAPVKADASALFIQLGDPIKRVFGVAQGWLMQRVLRGHGVVTEEFEWVYGDYPRTRPYEPHVDLDGVRFENFDSEVLANNEPWPEDAFHIPGSHDGCQCDCMLVTVQSAQEVAA